MQDGQIMLRSITYNLRKCTYRTYSSSVVCLSPATIHSGETIIERSDYPLDTCKDIIGDRKIAVLGYGPQGRGQALNLRDNGFDVCVGVRENGDSWHHAEKDGWTEGESLFCIEGAAKQGNIIQYLLSDAAQIQCWNTIHPHLTQGKTLYFSHGFGLTFHEDTRIVPPKNIDVLVVAPKGSGLTVRTHFLEGRGINSSYAIHQDVSGSARDTCLALAFGIGTGHAFETTTEKEVFSDLTGERCVLMGLIQGAFSAQYSVLRENGHSPSEAYNETVEEALESLYPLISKHGMDWMFANCSTTAQRGALDWAPRFESALYPIIQDCYEDVKSGVEARRSIEANSDPDYRSKLNEELEEIRNSELWTTARELRKYRPE